MSKMAGTYLVFTDGEETDSDDLLIEVTARRPGGIVEIAFTFDLERVHLTLSLPQLVALAMEAPEEATP